MLSKNEWDPLKSVVVGIADDAKIPPSTFGLRTVNYADLTFSEYLAVKHGLYPKQVIDEAIEDLETLCAFLRSESVNVVRPNSNAANILRCNDDLFYLVSNTGNKKGAEYLQEVVGPNKRVHTIENVYSYIHLDSTIALLREGLMLLNPARIKTVEPLPEALRNWDVIWAPEPVDIGHYPGYCNASKWVSINLLSVNPKLVVLEEHQHNLRVELEKHGIESAMLPARHARTLGGCFHCVTLDLVRG